MSDMEKMEKAIDKWQKTFCDLNHQFNFKKECRRVGILSVIQWLDNQMANLKGEILESVINTKDKQGENMNKIVCAAIHQNGIVYCGIRPGSVLKHMRDIGVPKAEHVQGFVDKYNDFLTREDALVIAWEAKQIEVKTKPETKLFSEDLY